MIKPLPQPLSKGEGLNSSVINFTFLTRVEFLISSDLKWQSFLFHAREHFSLNSFFE